MAETNHGAVEDSEDLEMSLFGEMFGPNRKYLQR